MDPVSDAGVVTREAAVSASRALAILAPGFGLEISEPDLIFLAMHLRENVLFRFQATNAHLEVRIWAQRVGRLLVLVLHTPSGERNEALEHQIAAVLRDRLPGYQLASDDAHLSAAVLAA